MSTADVLRIVAEVLAAEAGADAPLQAVEVRDVRTPPGRGLRVSVHTSEPGRFIGRRGTTAGAIERELARRLDRPDTTFEIHQLPRPPRHDPPAGGGA